MKTLKLVIVAAVISASSLFTISCGGSEKEANPLADSLANVNGELSGQLSEKEIALQEFVNSFNEIQENLNAIKEKEKIVTSQSQSGDVKSKEESIKEDIQAIYDLLAKNKNRISSLTKKLKDSKSKITGLEQMIATLQAQIDAKDGEISDLKSQLEAKNIELSNIVMNLENVEVQLKLKK
jgi:chromosome segregation ATPase